MFAWENPITKKSLSGLEFKKFKLPNHFNPDIGGDDCICHKKIIRPKCRWCHGSTRPLSSNGIIGPGYREGNYVCNDCGRVQRQEIFKIKDEE